MLGRRCKRWPNDKPAPVHSTRDCRENWPCACCTLIDMMCIACVRSGNKEMQTPPPRTVRAADIISMLWKRCRCWPNIEPTLVLFSGYVGSYTTNSAIPAKQGKIYAVMFSPRTTLYCAPNMNWVSGWSPLILIIICVSQKMNILPDIYEPQSHIHLKPCCSSDTIFEDLFQLLTLFCHCVSFICLTVMYTVLSFKCFCKIVCSCKQMQINIYSILFMYDGCHHGTLCMMWYRVRINTHPNSFMKIRLFLSMEKMVQKKLNPLIFYILFYGYAL